jgi:hypothetical protein
MLFSILPIPPKFTPGAPLAEVDHGTRVTRMPLKLSIIRPKKRVAGKEASSRIVGLAGVHRHLVPAFVQPACEVIDWEVLRPEVLGDDQDPHGPSATETQGTTLKQDLEH